MAYGLGIGSEKKILASLSSAPLRAGASVKKLWGFDVETYGDKNKFYMVSIVGDKGIRRTYYDSQQFIDYLKKQCSRIYSGGYICATNLQFDFMALIHETDSFNEMRPLIRNSSMLLCQLPVYYSDKVKYLKFIDTLNFVKMGVEEWGKRLNYPKLEKPSFLGRKPKTASEKEELLIYNMRDAEITYKAMQLIQKGYNNIGGRLRITAASSALDTYRRKFQKEIYLRPPDEMLSLLYNGYYGGRCEVIIRGTVNNFNYYDVNSLYPSVMVREYPHPNYLRHSSKVDKRSLYEFEGVCFARLHCPYMYIPYLPYRSEGKLKFPCGNIEGYYSFYEIRRAIELGYDLIELGEGVIYFRIFKPFEDYVRDLWKLRKEQKANNDPLELATKLNLNGLYGKFAQKIDSREEIIHEDKVTIEMIRKAKDFTHSGHFFIFNKPYTRIPGFVNPIFSIYTTAYARDVLYKYIQQCKNAVLYYDTDSIFTPKELETGDGLGELKRERIINEGILIKPKMYLMDDKPKCKGVNRINKAQFMDLLEGKGVQILKFAKFKECNKRGLSYNQKLVFDKLIDLEDDKRKWLNRAFDPLALERSEPINI